MDTEEQQSNIHDVAADAVSAWQLQMAHSAEGLHVLVDDGNGGLKCVGWEKWLPSPRKFEPGTFLRGHSGYIYVAKEGSVAEGARLWGFVGRARKEAEGAAEEISKLDAEFERLAACGCGSAAEIKSIYEKAVNGPGHFREEPGDTRREEKEESKAAAVEDSGADTGSFDAPLPTSPYLERRYADFFENRMPPFLTAEELARLAFFAGVDAKADQITEQQLAEDLECRERWEESMSRWEEEVAWVKDQGFSKADLFEAFQAGGDAREERIFCSDGANGMVNKPEPVLPSFEVALTRMADAECSEDWCYNAQNLETDPGVITLAVLYEKPILEVARAVADRRREWVKRFLAEAG